ncbi:hypothetical protein LZ198_05170 [Myxococcus sp. K15C18031901]|uniref:hypothetical protein n=1 Tax=Myxococcus dinghuensis TaxID=2906761 RepID=UPI0020A80570|nr:hypothetical protein [Myxococcus dinghuensis]MCP3098268.1 hypothetical protein [Myxococcus dinghuensis]
MSIPDLPVAAMGWVVPGTSLMGDCCVDVDDDGLAFWVFFAPKRLEVDAEPGCGAPGGGGDCRLTFCGCVEAFVNELEGSGGGGGGAGGVFCVAAFVVGWDVGWDCLTGDLLELRLRRLNMSFDTSMKQELSTTRVVSSPWSQRLLDRPP